MSFDLFGHGIRRLPIENTQYYSDGPDRKHGPAKCRGVDGTCSYTPIQPHDHSCCCDPCRHIKTDVCEDGNCCRCVPRAICAIFTPTEETETCFAKNYYAKAAVSGPRTTYTFGIPDLGSLILSVGRPDNELYGHCTWRLQCDAAGIYEEVGLEHSGEIHCQAPPNFTLENVNIPFYPPDGSGALDCYGTLTFTEASLAKVPFRYKWAGIEQKQVVDCAYCVEACTVLCVKRGSLESEEYTRIEFVYNSYDERWIANDGSGDYFSITSIDDVCYIYLESMEDVDYQGFLIEIPESDCSDKLNLYASDYNSGKWIRISCNPCSCWDYICGTCRCVCKELCVVGKQDNTFVSPFNISWDYDTLRWGDDIFSVTPYKDEETGECKVSITGYDEPVTLYDMCSENFFAAVASDEEEQIDTGLVNYIYVSCKKCSSGDCSGGTCLSFCPDVPKILYADLSPTAWDEMLGCDPMSLCFSPITIELAQIFIGTTENPAGEYRWVGFGIIACKSCSPPTSPVNTIVSIDIGCDGIGRMTVGDMVFDFSLTIPCNGSAVWDFDFLFDGPGTGPCCDVAGFELNISE